MWYWLSCFGGWSGCLAPKVGRAPEVSTALVLLEYRYNGTRKNARKALGFAGVCLGLCGECMHELWDRKLIYLLYLITHTLPLELTEVDSRRTKIFE